MDNIDTRTNTHARAHTNLTKDVKTFTSKSHPNVHWKMTPNRSHAKNRAGSRRTKTQKVVQGTDERLTRSLATDRTPIGHNPCGHGYTLSTPLRYYPLPRALTPSPTTTRFQDLGEGENDRERSICGAHAPGRSQRNGGILKSVAARTPWLAGKFFIFNSENMTNIFLMK